MDIVQLKEQVLNNTLGNSTYIFKYVDNKFLCYSYIDKICENFNKEKKFINSIKDIDNTEDLFDSTNLYLFILDVEELTENIESQKENLIIVTKKFPEKFKEQVIEFPALINWQIEDFIAARLPGLSKEEIKWLCDISKYDIYRLDQECKKLEIFPEASQELIFNDINIDNGYSDLSPFSVLNLVSAVTSKNKVDLVKILADIDALEIPANVFINLMVNQLKLLIDVQINPKNTAESLGITQARYYAVSYNKNKYSNDDLINMYTFLTDINYKLVSGQLTFAEGNTQIDNDKSLLNYVLINLLNLCKLQKTV